ncbi:hypothetical protein [Rhizobium tumorigenes]|uniref:hypothetical protein n=1 Tax=Rhizobium tumorigenes TaxID=2041385 RepID=UPI00241CFBB4|nr:hypothetical protein [Rhizobium tumorigenes]WFS00297.1 hypothetical protein PR016_14265 [Rhizobium tumorigenes]
MLPPVAAVSSASPVAPQREVAVVTEMLSGISAEPDAAVALSLAANAGVEGKLNILLLNARARMLDSLFAVIDAVSQSLALPQAPGESKATYALRLADTMTELPPKQMAALQQQLAAKGQTAPLALVAAALHDPAGAEAAQLIAYLEVVRYKEKDLATKSVVASYGQNNSQADTAAAALPLPARNGPTQTSALPTTVSPQPGQPAAPTSAATAPADIVQLQPPETTVDPHPPETATIALKDPTDPQLRNPSVPAATAQPTTAPANTPAAQAPQAPQAQTAAAPAPSADPTKTPVPTLTPDESTPRANQQIRSDIKEGLKAVFDRLVQATGTDLLQTLAEAAPLADKAIAQALIADMIDGTELQNLPLPGAATAPDRTPPLANAIPVSLTPQTVADEQALPVLVANALSDQPEASSPVALQHAPAAIPPGLAVAFVTVPYTPGDDVVKNKEALRIDRVDAVDDDEHEYPGHQPQEDAEPEEEPETPAEEALDMLEAGPNSEASAGLPAVSRSSLTALPSPPSTEPVPSAGYALYQRMGA